MKTVNNFPLSRTINGLVADIFNNLPSEMLNTETPYNGFPPVNIYENNDGYNLEVSAPGYEKSDFKVKIDGRLLIVSAEHKTETSEENKKEIRREFSKQSFKRSFTINEKIDTGSISARYENGILKLLLPKKEEVKQSATEINIQ